MRLGAALRSAPAAAARALRRRLSRRSAPEPPPEETFADPFQWQSVTILADPAELAPDGRLPAPVATLGSLVETRLRPAPGGRGSELSIRTRPGPRSDPAGWKGEDPARRIRTALQQARQLAETGEVLKLEPQLAGRRRPSRGLLVELMAGDADQEDVV
ncbi:MAG: hypothetical protein JO144_17210 [Actinobacteria bacterium]|nr:hypothetical protein [Actinomycetota bacterium]